MKFDYYYGSQVEQFSFIRIPRVMLTDEAFALLSLQATPLGGTNRRVKRLLLRGYGEIPIKINPIGGQDAKWQYC